MAYNGIFRPEADHEKLDGMGITDDDVVKYIVDVHSGQPKQEAISHVVASRKVDEKNLAFVVAVLSRFDRPPN